jgi:hypothetical protein
MKRLGMLAAAAALVLGLALPALAQPPAPAFTVTFGGQLRVYGLAWDNWTDFLDTGSNSDIFSQADGNRQLPGGAKDSEAYFFQRYRLYTTVQTADKKVKGVWAIEVGDITWGLGGGASGDEYGVGTGTRTGPSQGGGLGADGVNVETKNLYLQFDIPFLPDANILLGAHNITWLGSPAGNFLDDDGWGIQLNWKMDPIDLQLWTVKIDENTRHSADDNTFYAARLGVNLTKDIRFTVEGLLVDGQCIARRDVPGAPGTSVPTTPGAPVTSTGPGPATATGTCVSIDLGDTYWVGASAQFKIADMTLHGAAVYGNRTLWSRPLQGTIEESGWGAQAIAQVPIGPLTTWWHAWYTTGDENRITGGGCEDVTAHPVCGRLAAGQDFSTNANSTNLTDDSDKLPIPITGASWANVPFVLEFVKGMATIGAPGFGSTHYSDSTGTWGVGGSATFALTPSISVGGGVGYQEATEGTGVYGDHIIEVDGGIIYRYNPNLTITGLAAYGFPDEGDHAWGVVWRTQLGF